MLHNRTLALGMAAACLITAPTFGVMLNYAGSYSLTSTGVFQFSNELVQTFTPAGVDLLFEDAGDAPGLNMAAFEMLQIADLKIGNKLTANTYDFNPATVLGGFHVRDDDMSLLFTADMTATELEVLGNTSTIQIDLSNIISGAGYIPGSSVIIDEFLNPSNQFSTTVTLNSPGDLVNVIDNNLTISSSVFSGSAPPRVDNRNGAVPEPLTATLGLMGLGVLGMATRRRAA